MPEPDETMLDLTLHHQLVPNSAKFRKDVEIQQKRTDSTARFKILRSAENCGPYKILPNNVEVYLFH